CSHCRERYYPQIAPCIIVAIRREDSILLAQHVRHRNGVHTVLENITMAEIFGSRNRFTRMAISKEAGGLVAVGFGPVLAGIFC
ncbi:hypothetical protein MJI20_32170, partial [Salmonella enterica subsp. enterica serovar Anatum]|nr:hypothetical protein [Salmonella enterica subsp. enterica serovar Anatum]